MDAQELQNLEKVSKIRGKNLSSIVNKMSNTKSYMIAIKSKGPIKKYIIKLDQSNTYPEENTTRWWFIQIFV